MCSYAQIFPVICRHIFVCRCYAINRKNIDIIRHIRECNVTDSSRRIRNNRTDHSNESCSCDGIAVSPSMIHFSKVPLVPLPMFARFNRTIVTCILLCTMMSMFFLLMYTTTKCDDKYVRKRSGRYEHMYTKGEPTALTQIPGISFSDEVHIRPTVGDLLYSYFKNAS